MCVRIAVLLMGKHKPTCVTKKVGNGDHCIVANALNIKMTGKKKFKKTLNYHTGFVGHLKQIPYRNFMEEKPEHLVFRILKFKKLWFYLKRFTTL